MEKANRAWSDPLLRMSFSSDDLPAQLDDQARYEAWRDVFLSTYVPIEADRLNDRPFHARYDCAQLDMAAAGQLSSTVYRFARTPRAVAEYADDRFTLLGNRGPLALSAMNAGRTTELDSGTFTIVNNTDPGEVRSHGGICVWQVIVPGKLLREAIGNPDDFVARRLDASNPVLRHMGRYIGILLGPEGVGDEPDLQACVGSTLVDLLTLALGAGRDAMALASMRGLRAARAQDILAQIRAGFADPAFSPAIVAAKIGLSPRYVQGLLHDTGTSFSERVLELRLQKARAMLAQRRNDRLKVSEIAYACGFSDISYFNQAFRRRFGAPPSHFRGTEDEP
jgi:AraC-like DNA-binding protein